MTALLMLAVLGAAAGLIVWKSLDLGGTGDRGSHAQHAALGDGLHDSLFRSRPPSTAALLGGDTQSTGCGVSGDEPYGFLAYALRSDGRDVAAYFRKAAQQDGWRLVGKAAILTSDPLPHSSPALVFHRSSHGSTLELSVDFGKDDRTSEPSAQVSVFVADAHFCPG